MGVMGTWCQLCGLPVQHDHYVPDGSGHGLKIYRQGSEDGGHQWEDNEKPMKFGPEHQWLKDAVAIARDDDDGPAVLHGVAQDGNFEDANGEDSVFVANGDEDAYVFHAVCWKAMGKPAPVEPEQIANRTHRFSLQGPYQQQLFDVRTFVDDGKAWAFAEMVESEPEPPG